MSKTNNELYFKKVRKDAEKKFSLTKIISNIFLFKVSILHFKIGNNDVCKNLINSYDPDEESIKDEYEKLKKMISLAK